MAAGPTEARSAGARTLYLECESGISGDMVVAALLDAGASEKAVRDALASLPLGGYDVRITRKPANGIDCCDFDVVLDDAHQNHDHDMAYLYGDLDGVHDHHDHAHDHHHHEHDHDHAHDHEYDHHDHAHHHEHRNLSDVLAVIDAGSLTPGARNLAHRIFQILADAESKAHGVPVDQVHFHEVGAVDSIVDVVAAAVCLDNLGVTSAVVSPLAEGHGRVRTQHGVLPVPVPAVVNIAAAHGLTLAPRDAQGELVTPTGAAIAAAIQTADALPPAYAVRAVGYGRGKRAYEPVSMVRAMLIEPRPAQPTSAPDVLIKLETEVDDCTGEALGNALAKLFSAGAREAHYVPIYMKKNRPAWQIEVLCSQDRVAACERVLFEETTTIGVRRHPVERTALPREEKDVRTPLGPAQVKVVTLPGGATRAYPEHDSVVALAESAGVSYQDAYRAVLAAASQAE
ncbi:MAG: nickel pincer cofactor biosynthesis protein LarC [Coriobacteriaceae bacterium]|nr:MAG: nickel pincer cofactor biosynthesis protein LarC [Coriobacteriaceae bacterium]